MRWARHAYCVYARACRYSLFIFTILNDNCVWSHVCVSLFHTIEREGEAKLLQFSFCLTGRRRHFAFIVRLAFAFALVHCVYVQVNSCVGSNENNVVIIFMLIFIFICISITIFICSGGTAAPPVALAVAASGSGTASPATLFEHFHLP